MDKTNQEQIDEQVVDEEIEQPVNDEEVVEKSEVELLQEQIQVLEDKNLRLLAEFNNYKKRSSEEFMQAKVQGKAEVFKKLIDSIDNFERALEQECSDNQFYSGMKMIYDKIKTDSESLGLSEIDCSGKLDHNQHQALMVEEHEDLDDDQIIDVLQKGYAMDNILVRPSMVKVNKKPTK